MEREYESDTGRDSKDWKSNKQKKNHKISRLLSVKPIISMDLYVPVGKHKEICSVVRIASKNIKKIRNVGITVSHLQMRHAGIAHSNIKCLTILCHCCYI